MRVIVTLCGIIYFFWIIFRYNKENKNIIQSNKYIFISKSNNINVFVSIYCIGTVFFQENLFLQATCILGIIYSTIISNILNKLTNS